MVLSLVLSVWAVTQPGPRTTFKTQAGVTQQTMVSLFPQQGSLKLEDKEGLSIGILLESGDKTADRVDIILGFDPQKAEVAGLTSGMAMDSYVVTRMDNNLGQVVVSAVNNKPRASNGILASFRLKPKTLGEMALMFKQSAGVEKAVGGMYTITK